MDVTIERPGARRETFIFRSPDAHEFRVSFIAPELIRFPCTACRAYSAFVTYATYFACIRCETQFSAAPSISLEDIEHDRVQAIAACFDTYWDIEPLRAIVAGYDLVPLIAELSREYHCFAKGLDLDYPYPTIFKIGS